jgi:ubiquinone/menaquinone biosynthesis C-methylase UbiE
MKWFRPAPSPYKTPLAMIGAKAGDRIAMFGADSGELAAEVALLAGLNGRLVVVDVSPGAQARVERAASQAGALVEFESVPLALLPFDDASFDIAVLTSQLSAPDDSIPIAALEEVRRILRPAGRVIVIEKGPRPGVLGLIQRGDAPKKLPPAAVSALLKSAGFLAVRLLADVDGTSYLEGRRP